MSNCFSKIIGIKEACSQDYVPKLFINQIGMNLELLDQYAGSNYSSGLDLFNEKLEFAGDAMASEMLAQLSKKIKGTTIIANIAIGYIPNQSGNNTALGDGNWVGIRIRQDSPSFIALTLKDIKLNIDTTGNIPLKIFDYRTKKIVKDITVTANDWSQLNEVIQSLGRDIDIVIGYESLFTSTRTLVNRNVCTNGCPPSFISCSDYTDVVGVRFVLSGADLGTLSNVGNTYGMQLNYNITCNYQSWLCSLSQVTALPLLYKVAADITEYAIHFAPNERVNNSVDNKENLKSQYQFFTQKYNEALNTLLTNMRLPAGDDCFYCKENLRYTISLP